MTATYYIKATSDGGYAVQELIDGLDDFHSYHRTREAAEAALASAYLRDAAGDLFAVVILGQQMRAAQRAYFKTRTQQALRDSLALEKDFDRIAHDVLTKARGEFVQGGLL